MKTWPTKKLSEIARIFSGSSAPQDKKYFKNGKYPFVRVFDLATPRSGVELVETRDYVNDLAITELNLVEAKKGAIVFPKSGASVLNNNRAMLGTNAYVVSHLSAIEADEDLAVRNWVYYFLSKFDMGKLVSDPGYPSLNISAIEKIKIPVPPLAIQKQIVERLDKIAEAQKLNDELIQKSDEFFQSLLYQELNPAGKDWEVKKIKDVAVVKNGGTPSTKNPKYWSGKVLWLTPKELSGFEGMEISDTERKISDDGLKHSSATILPVGTVLLTSRAPIGYIAIAGAPMATNQGFKNFICDSKQLNNRFLYFFLRLKTKYLKSLGRGATFTEISKTAVEKIDIPLPPLEAQKQVVTKLSAAQEYKTKLLVQKSKLKELFNSALAKSFQHS